MTPSPRNTCSTKQRFPKVSGPRHELITLNLHSLDPTRQINNTFSSVLIFANKPSTVLSLAPLMTKATDRSMESEFHLPWLCVLCGQSKAPEVWNDSLEESCLLENTYTLKVQCYQPGVWPGDWASSLSWPGRITAGLRRVKYPNEPSNLTYGTR